MDVRGKKAGELAGIEFACSCGMTHKVDIEKVAIGPDMLPEAAAWINALSPGKVVLVYDEVIAPIAGDALRALIPGSEAVVLQNRNGLPLAPDESNIGELLVRVPADAGFLLAVGSGVINDMTRHVSFKMGIPYAIFATAPSMDGYASVTSSLIVRNVKGTILGQMPKAIFADTAILGAAPAVMLAAGFGDVLGKRNAIREWHFAREYLGEHYCPVMADLVMDAVALCEAHAEGLPKRDPAAVEAVMEALVLAGMVMGMYRNTRPASVAEHYFSHLWELAHLGADQDPPLSHGHKVAIVTLAMSAFYERFLARDLTSLDIDAAVAAWAPWEEVEADIRARFQGALADHAVAETHVKYVDAAGLRERLGTFVGRWAGLRPRLEKQLAPARTLQQMLRDAGAPAAPEDIGLTAADVKATFPQAMYYRSRYTVLDLAREAGWFEGLVDEVFAPGGLWS